jgi:hypothetical protein
MGYEVPLAAEALRRCENDVEAAVCMLCDSAGHEAVLLAVMQRQEQQERRRRQQPRPGSGLDGQGRGATGAMPASAGPPVDEESVKLLVEMGFSRSAAVRALRDAGNDVSGAALALGTGRYADDDAYPANMDVSDAMAAGLEAGGTGAAPAPVPEPPPPPPQMTDEEHEAVRRSALRDAVQSTERAYNETSSLDHAKVVIQLLLERLEE